MNESEPRVGCRDSSNKNLKKINFWKSLGLKNPFEGICFQRGIESWGFLWGLESWVFGGLPLQELFSFFFFFLKRSFISFERECVHVSVGEGQKERTRILSRPRVIPRFTNREIMT